MHVLTRSIAAAALLVLLAAPAVRSAPAPSETFRGAMDRVFGPGGWRQTSGWRSRAREDALRRQGAGTVPAGRRSSHSLGGPAAPGAYDAVVPGMSQTAAAALLRRSGQRFPRVLAEPAHGPEGPHLHVELMGAGGRARHPSPCDAYHGETIYLRIINGRQNPLVACEGRSAPAGAGEAGP